jgi:hypothetical protein
VIKYALLCDQGHGFDSWFPDSEAFETQARRGLVACPDCDSVRVTKAIMAPAVAAGRESARAKASKAAAPGPVTLLDHREQRLRAMMRALRDEIMAKSDNVGRNFPDAARKMHLGEEPPRSIRGEATGAEVKELIEEGIGVLPMPNLPEERN